MKKYDDIINLSRPQYEDLPPMPIHDRAAQFSPFAALVGYDAVIDETIRLTDNRRELTEDEERELNASLRLLMDSIARHPKVTVTYFVPDERKSGGSYREKTGIVRGVNENANTLVFADGTVILITDLYSITL